MSSLFLVAATRLLHSFPFFSYEKLYGGYRGENLTVIFFLIFPAFAIFSLFAKKNFQSAYMPSCTDFLALKGK